MQELKNDITQLNTMVLEGKAIEAFEQFYHEDIVMQENDQEPVEGKEANRQREIEFFGNITEFRGAEVLDVAIGNDVTMVTWKFDYSHKEWGDRNYTQVAVQHWRDGKISKERFFYGN